MNDLKVLVSIILVCLAVHRPCRAEFQTVMTFRNPGDEAPGFPEGTRVEGLLSFRLNNRGKVAISARVWNPNTGHGGAGVWTGTPGDLTLRIVDSEQFPGVETESSFVRLGESYIQGRSGSFFSAKACIRFSDDGSLTVPGWFDSVENPEVKRHALWFLNAAGELAVIEEGRELLQSPLGPAILTSVPIWAHQGWGNELFFAAEAEIQADGRPFAVYVAGEPGNLTVLTGVSVIAGVALPAPGIDGSTFVQWIPTPDHTNLGEGGPLPWPRKSPWFFGSYETETTIGSGFWVVGSGRDTPLYSVEVPIGGRSCDFDEVFIDFLSGVYPNSAGEFLALVQLKFPSDPCPGSGRSALVLFDDGTQETILKAGDRVPDHSELGIVRHLVGGHMNHRGDVTFLTVHDTWEAVWIRTQAGELRKVYQRGSAVPGREEYTFDHLLPIANHVSYYLNDSGQVIFRSGAWKEGPFERIGRAGLWITDGLETEEIFFSEDFQGQEFDRPPSTECGVVRLNDYGQTVFSLPVGPSERLFLYTPDLLFRGRESSDWGLAENWKLSIPPGPVHHVAIKGVDSELRVRGPSVDTQVRSLRVGGEGMQSELVLLEGTRIAASDGVSVDLNGVLSGSGTLSGDVTNRGTLSPGNSAGRIVVEGNYSQEASGRVRIEIFGLDEFDQLEVTGEARLGGIIELVFSSSPPSESVEFLQAGAIADEGVEVVVIGIDEDLVQVDLVTGTVVRTSSSFRRGDSNEDSAFDIADAIHTLGVLFLGSGGIACGDAADSNDDGEVDITDAVHSLGVLFLGQVQIPPPGTKSCGPDPSEDSLECEGFAPCS